MDVYNTNFSEALEEVTAYLDKECEFMALDFEMTGIQLTDKSWRSSYADTPEERYARMRPVAMRYSIIQLGLCLFNWKEGTDELVARPFNFYSFPAKGEDLVLSVESIAFLRAQSMDFQKWITKGISFVDGPSEQALWDQLEREREAAKGAKDDTRPFTVSKQSDVDFVEGEMRKVDDWVARKGPAAKEAELSLSRCNAFLRRALHSAVQTRNPDLVTETRGGQVVVLRLTEEEKAEREVRKDAERVAKVNDVVGLRRLFKAMTQAKVPLVVHNGMYDLLFLMQSLHGPLPESYAEFKKQITACFPCGIYDTKYMAHRDDLHKLSFEESGTGVEPLYEALVTKPKWSKVSLAPGFQKYAGNGSDKEGGTSYAHEAGYDAYLTGCINFALRCKLQPWEFSKLANRIFNFKSLFELNLAGEDVQAFKGHVLHAAIGPEAKSVTTDELKGMVEGEHPSHLMVLWVDDKCAFLVVNGDKSLSIEDVLAKVKPRPGVALSPLSQWLAAKGKPAAAAAAAPVADSASPLGWLSTIHKRLWSWASSSTSTSTASSATQPSASPPVVRESKRARR